MRPISACCACRLRRKKCVRPGRGTSCNFCNKKGFDCKLDDELKEVSNGGYEPLFTSIETPAARPVSSTVVLDFGMVEELVEIYFRYVHVAFHNIFHRQSFERSIRNGSLPKILIYGVIGLVARFSKHAVFEGIEPKARGRPYAKEAESLLDLHNRSLTTIQACMLIGAIQGVEMDSMTESIFYTMACRMAMMLDLPTAATESRLERELNIRVWWSVVCTDTWTSAALKLPRAIQPQYDIDLPIDERVFAQLDASYDSSTPTDSSSPVLQCRSSPIAEMIKLNGILHQVNVLNMQAASDTLNKPSLDDMVATIFLKLNDWQSNLPADLRYCPENLSYWAELGFGQLFVLLHVNFNHTGQLLFFQFLCRNPASLTPAVVGSYRNNCKCYAARLCSIIYHAKQNINTDVNYALVGHMLVVASTVQIYTLLFSQTAEEVDNAKARLEQNFTIIKALETYWPSLEATFARLSAINKACFESPDSAFKLDEWMLRFIQDFAQPIEERKIWEELKRYDAYC